LYSTTAVILLDSDGNRVIAKYFSTPNVISPNSDKQSFSTFKEQRAFEQAIWEKTRRAQGEILLYAKNLILFKPSLDLIFYVVGPEGENEIMLNSLLSAFYDSVSLLLRHQVEKRAVLENLDMVVLALDECVDDGIILETDPQAIASRVSRPKPDAGLNLSDITIDEQFITNTFRSVKEKIGQKILMGA